MSSKPDSPLIQLHFSGDAYFAGALRAISEATEEVLLESYIYDLDPIGLRILQALEAAHHRGVRVRLLVDGIGSFNWWRSLRAKCANSGLPFRVYHPLPVSSKIRLSWRALRKLLLLFRRMNQRNHRKVIMIDRKIAFLGSLNISQVHTEEFMGDHAWRDTGVEIRFSDGDADAALLRSAFFRTWQRTERLRVSTYPARFLRRLQRMHQLNSRLRLNSFAWGRYLLLKDLLIRMRTAKHRIYITNAYFIPRRAILIALRRAARRGVHVALVLPQKTDVWFVREAARSLYLRLLLEGIHIYEYKPRVLHAKTLVIDDWGTVGSHNLNHRSLLHDLEVETVIDEPQLVEQLISRWRQDVRESNEITLEDLGKFPFYRRWISRLVYWFRYWL